MKLETFPLILGAVIALIGLALVVDSRMPDRGPRRERRRRTRRERNRGGELLIGVGVVAMGVAVIGRDSWRYSILTILVGVGLLVVGVLMNRHYLGELVFNRGAARRRPEDLRDRPVPTGRPPAVFAEPTPPTAGTGPTPPVTAEAPSPVRTDPIRPAGEDPPLT